MPQAIAHTDGLELVLAGYDRENLTIPFGKKRR